MWSIVRNIKKFTTKSEVDKVLGEPKFQLNGRVYYYGKGMLIAYAPIRFKVEGMERIEYGEKGEYVINVYCFTDVEMLKLEFELNDFGATDMTEISRCVIEGEISSDSSFREIHKLKVDGRLPGNYREGETRRLENDELIVKNLFIQYERYMFFFLGKSKKGKMSGFEYTLPEV